MADTEDVRGTDDEPKDATKTGGRRRRRSRGFIQKPSDLGYAQDAGHPGGEQDLDAKSDTEGEHDVFGRHE
jgi:hypothetical protein